MPVYSYYDYLENYYEDYYEYYYWPSYYGYNHTTNMTTYNGTYPPSPWKQPYPMEICNPLIWGTSILCAVLSVLIFGFVLRQIYRRRKARKLRTSRTTLVLTVSCLLVHVVWCCLDSVSYYRWYIHFTTIEATKSIDLPWDVFWCLSKISLYFVFMNRYYNIFNAATRMNTAGKRKRVIMFGVFMLVVFLQMVLISVYMVFYYLYERLDWVFHSKRIYVNACWMFLVIDLVLVAVISFFLNRSILKLIVFQSAVSHMSDLSHITKTADHSMPPAEPTRTRDDTLGVASTEMTSPRSSTSDFPVTITHAAAEKETVSADFDRDRVASASDLKSGMSQISDYDEKKGKYKLLHTSTRIMLTCVISILSSFVYQLVWNIAQELENGDVLWFTYTWSIDAVINMVCVYLSMGISVSHYRSMCVDVCHCHQCCFSIMLQAVAASTQSRVRKLTKEQEKERPEFGYQKSN